MYNSELTLSKTIDSVLNQLNERYTVEILLINDGSTDNTNEIALEYTNMYDFIKYFYQTNAGVSVARNLGLDNSEGKYILFLDSDDTLAKDTISGVIKGFNLFENQTDVLVYPLYNISSDGTKKNHIRNRNFKKRGIYEIYNIFNYPHLNQCTINIVIKNFPQNKRIYFDESLKQSEDALFNTTQIMRSKNLLYINCGGYEYHIDQFSTVDKYKSPVNIGNMIFEFFEKMIQISKNNNENVTRYVQSMILYELNWRFKQSTLYPEHLKSNEFKVWLNRLKKIFNSIEVDTIMTHPLIDYYHKIHFIEKFKGEISYEKEGNVISFYSSEDVLFRIDFATLVFNKIRKENDKIHFQGFIKLPLLSHINNVTLKIDSVNKSYTAPLSETPASYYKVREKIADFLAFDVHLPLDLNKEYSWKVWLDDQEVITHLYFDKDVMFQFKNKVVFYNEKQEEYNISYNTKPVIFKIEKNNQSSQTKKQQLDQLLRKKAGNSSYLMYKYKNILDLKYKGKRIWLYNDRKGVKDNAYLQFKNDIGKKDGIDRYYVIRKGDENIIDIPNKNTVIYGTLKHKILYIYSELILTSFKDYIEYSPLSYRAENLFYKEVKRKIIYLQHGVLNAHTPWLYGKHVTKFDKFLISSHFEKENLMQNYGYEKEDLLEAGMIRLDYLEEDKHKRKKKILFAPSWRKELVNEKSSIDRKLRIEDIKKSPYYSGINKLINSKKLSVILEKYNYSIDVKLHPIFLTEDPIFKSESDKINIIGENEDIDINEYSLFITDFSSFLFDFIKTKTRMAFFIPDLDYFLSGNHIYNKLDYDISNFAEVYSDSNDLITFIKENIKDDFKLPKSIKELYEAFYFSNEEKTYGNQVYNKLLTLNYEKKIHKKYDFPDAPRSRPAGDSPL